MSEHPGEAIERRIKKDFYDSLDRRSAAAQPAPGRWYWTQETVVGEKREHLLRRLFLRSAEGDEYYAVTDGAEGHIEELAVYLNALETERDRYLEAANLRLTALLDMQAERDALLKAIETIALHRTLAPYEVARAALDAAHEEGR